MIKTNILLLSALVLPLQLFATENDSVYQWGTWANGDKPATGAMKKISPQPAIQPDINFRPNENAAFLRDAIQRPNIVTGFGIINNSIPLNTSPPPLSTPPPPPPDS